MTHGIHEKERVWENIEHCLQAISDFLIAGNTWRMNVIYTRPDIIRIAVMFERIEQLHVALRSFNGDNVRIQSLDRGENVIEVGVAEV